MFGMREVCTCPICGKEYENNPGNCECGFEGMVFLPAFCTDEIRQKYEAQRKEEAFRIFKFAKEVYYGEKEYPRSQLVTFRRETRVDVDEALERGGLAVVAPTEEERGGLPTVAIEGLVAMRSNVRALILNTDEAEHSMLDESGVETLLLGADFKRLCDGSLMQYAPLRYVWADGKNKHFTAEDNVLFNKDKSKLYLYARNRPGEEYRVPESVKSLAPYSFFSPNHLRRLYLPRGIRGAREAMAPRNLYVSINGEAVRMEPPFEVIYY